MSKELNEVTKVAFIFHPLTVNEFKKKTYLYFPFDRLVFFLLKVFPSNLVKKIYSILPPHIILKEKNIQSASKKNIDLYGIMVGVFPEEIIFSKENAILKITKAVEFAIRKGVEIVVLTGFTSIVTEEGALIRRAFQNTSVCITSGNTYTAALCIEGVETACMMFGRNISELTIAIVGASGDIGSACARSFVGKVKSLNLCNRKINENDSIVLEMKKAAKHVFIFSNVKDAVKDADIVIFATSSYLPLVSGEEFKVNAIVCDASLPANVPEDILDKRRDVFVFDGGKAKLDSLDRSYKWKKIFFNNSIFGCIAEGLILGFEKIFDDYSMDRGKINENAIESIFQLGQKNGIGLADFSFHQKKYSSEQLNIFKKNFKT